MNTGSTSQGPGEQPQAPVKQRAEVGLSIEVILNVVFGVFFVLLGLLLIGIIGGLLVYSEDSTRGLFLVLVALQMITTGQTPFGNVRLSWLMVIVGLIVAALGTLAVFLPGNPVLSIVIDWLAGIILVVGGILGLVRTFAHKETAETLKQIGRIGRHTKVALGILYLFGIILGLGVFFPTITYNIWIVPEMLIFGASFFYVAWCVHRINVLYRPEELKTPGT